jgi:hypothetical protein
MTFVNESSKLTPALLAVTKVFIEILTMKANNSGDFRIYLR